MRARGGGTGRAVGAATLLGAAVALAGCVPDLEQSLSLIDTPRVLAIQAEPAEALPGEPVHYRVLVAAPPGAAADEPSWALCTRPLAAGQRAAAVTACLADTLALGHGASVDAVLPREVCSRYGPDVSSSSLRPPDPDATGGYYQPLRVDLGDSLVLGFQRIRCNLAGAPLPAIRDHAARYRPNQNPSFSVDAPAVVSAAQTVRLVATWPATAAESYLALPPGGSALVDRREALRVSWFSSAGALADEHTGRAESDLATSTETTWQAPSAPGPVRLWVVLRDSRGGVAFITHDLVVR